MSFTRLPPELLRLIAQYIRANGLYESARVARTCRSFRHPAQTVLFEYIDIDELYGPDYWQHEHQLEHHDYSDIEEYWLPDYEEQCTYLFETLAEGPRIAGYVRTLIFNVEEAFCPEEAFWTTLCKALENLCGLKTLVFKADSVSGPVPGNALAACTFQLEHLTWNCEDNKEDTIAFLFRQNSLRSLRWDTSLSTGIPKNVFSQLTSFSGSFLGCLALLPDRKVRNLRLRASPGGLDIASEDFGELFPALGSIERLSLVGRFNDQFFIKTLAPHLSSLRGLNLAGMLLAQDNLEDIRLPALEHLIIDPEENYYEVSCPNLREEGMVAFLDVLFKNHPRLRLIHVRTSPQKYKRYPRGKTQSPITLSGRDMYVFPEERLFNL